MTENLYLTSVADVFAYDFSDNLVFSSKVLLDSSVEISLGNTDVRGGKNNPLRYIYWHTPDGTLTLTETQFSLSFLAQNVGSVVGTGANTYTTETVTLGAANAGTVTGTPIAIQGASKYGWVELVDGTTERVTFTGSNFTTVGGAQGDVVCVRYYHVDSAAKTMTINASIIPSQLRLVLEAQLASNSDSQNVVGSVELIVPKATLSGAFSLNMAADQVANLPIKARMLASTPAESLGCANGDVLMYINQIRTSATWRDGLAALAFVGGDKALTHPSTYTLTVRAIYTDGTVGTPPVADLTFASGTVGTCTVGANSGVVSTVAAGTSTISCFPTAAPAFDAYCIVTVS